MTGGLTLSLAAGAAKVRVWPRKARWGAATRAERSNACRENMVTGGGGGLRCDVGTSRCREASSSSVFRLGFGNPVCGLRQQAAGGRDRVRNS